jgi:GMP synthase (glutamine-hydrolysing)
MKPVLFLKNITLEGPGLMEKFLSERNIPFEILDLYTGEPVPGDCRAYSCVVCLGGPMNIYEEEQFLFLRYEKAFLLSCIEQKIPILGLCLGAQLLADVLGAKVYKNSVSEIGCLGITLTEEAQNSRLFSNIPTELTVFQWHGDTFDIPEGSIRLAESKDCRNQAFGWNDIAFGLQFHIEVDLKSAQKWAQAYLPDISADDKIKANQIIESSENDWPENLEKHAFQLFENFFIEIVSIKK